MNNKLDRSVLETARSVAEIAPPPITKMVSMRDGTKLATDVYLPNSTGPWPTIVERTPYNRRGESGSEISFEDQTPLTRVQIANYYRDQGFAVVMQDVRGRFGSEGEFSKYIHEADDGYDTYTWIVDQDWCDGRLCTMGLSYGAHTQVAAACAGAPGIASMIIDTGGLLNTMKYSLRYGGAFELKQLTWMLRNAKAQATADGDLRAVGSIAALDARAAVFDGVWRQGESPLAVMPDYEASLFDMWNADTSTEEWKSPATCAERWLDRFPNVPVLLIGSWNDPYATSMCRLQSELSARLSRPPTTIMGPWLHGKRSWTYAGEVDFGLESTLDHLVGRPMLELRVDWFQHVLAGRDNPVPAETNIFKMQMETKTSKNKATHRAGGGEWVSQPNKQNQGSLTLFASTQSTLNFRRQVTPNDTLTLLTNPSDPFPTLGGAITSGGDLMQGGMFKVSERPDFPAFLHRSDVGFYVSPKLARPIEFFGSPKVRARVLQSESDFDLVAWLFYCEGDGSAEELTWFNITDGIRRIQSTSGTAEVELMSSCFEFAKGSRIGLLITSSNFPRFDLAGKARMPGNANCNFVHNLELTNLELLLPAPFEIS